MVSFRRCRLGSFHETNLSLTLLSAMIAQRKRPPFHPFGPGTLAFVLDFWCGIAAADLGYAAMFEVIKEELETVSGKLAHLRRFL